MKESHKLIVTEIFLKEGCRHGRYFRVPIDGKGCYVDDCGNTFDYRSRGSVNSFFFGVKKRNQKKKERLYHACDEDEHITTLAITKKLSNHPMPSYIDVDSVWDFYKLINYDYKARKWL